MLCVVVLGSHQPRVTVRSARLSKNLLPGRLGLKLAVALSALETEVF